MSSTYEITIQHIGGATEKVTCGWTFGPKDGVLHLHDIQDPDTGNHFSRAVVLRNVVGYEERRLR